MDEDRGNVIFLFVLSFYLLPTSCMTSSSYLFNISLHYSVVQLMKTFVVETSCYVVNLLRHLLKKVCLLELKLVLSFYEVATALLVAGFILTLWIPWQTLFPSTSSYRVFMPRSKAAHITVDGYFTARSN